MKVSEDMYSNKFVMCVLVNGKPMSELANGQVNIPYGEYSLRFRNKHDRRAIVEIWIDGENVSGNGYIIPARGVVTIERHNETPTKFKFVDLDSPEAVEAGKNGPNTDKSKGVIVAKFRLEKQKLQPQRVDHYHWPMYVPPIKKYLNDPPFWYSGSTYQGPNIRGGVGNDIQFSASHSSVNHIDSAALNQFSLEGSLGAAAAPTEGVTVEGSYSTQTFSWDYVELEDTSTTLRIFLMGYVPTRDKKSVVEQEIKDLEIELLELRKKQLEEEIEKLRRK